MPTAILEDRAFVSVSGPDAEHFLQNLITTDLAKLAAGEARPGALLTPQGKIMFDFLIARYGDDGFVLECRADIADDFMRRLMLYRLRAKVEISKLDQDVASVTWRDDSSASQTDSTDAAGDFGWVRDMRFADATVMMRPGAAPDASASPEDYAALRVAHAVAESGADFELGDAFPHDVLFDQNGGVGLKKGCFVGQEVVSRMHHRGTARRRLLQVQADSALPAAGTEITNDGRAVGTLGTVAGENGLAIARIDKVKAAIDAGVPLLAGDTEVSLSIPVWAQFTFPEKSKAQEAE